MTKRQVWRYRCEFCKKSGCVAYHISRHEKTCTANPNRKCEIHKHVDEPQRPMPELIAILTAHVRDNDWDKAMSDLRDATDNCPVCILAAIRQSEVQKYQIDDEGPSGGADLKFDFKAELAEFWKEVNAAEDEADQERYAYERG